ncbi:MAG TPA: TrkA C-terminal domain-containing protein [Acidimicrobiales bacterium]
MYQSPPSNVSDRALPGIGHRYDLRAVDGGRVVVVVHHSGRRDVYTFTPGGEEPDAVVTLTDSQARTLGAILGGAYFKPAVVEEIEAVIGGLLIDWITLEPQARGVGKTIAELKIRQTTGMTIVAIVRKHAPEPLIAPPPDERLEAGDQLVVIGRQEDLPRFEKHVARPGEGANSAEGGPGGEGARGVSSG